MKKLIKQLVVEAMSDEEWMKHMHGAYPADAIEKKTKAAPPPAKWGQPGFEHNMPKSKNDAHVHPATRNSANQALKAWFSDGWEGDMDEIEVGQTKEYDPIPGLLVGDYSWDHEGRWFEVTVMDINDDGEPAYMEVKRTE